LPFWSDPPSERGDDVARTGMVGKVHTKELVGDDRGLDRLGNYRICRESRVRGRAEKRMNAAA